MSKIEINNIYKIFGNNPDSVMDMVKGGATKDEVLEQTGHTVGLDNVSLNIEEGETFVCMGLSGSGKSTLIRHLNRLIDPTAGEILIDGENVMSLNPEQLKTLDALVVGIRAFNTSQALVARMEMINEYVAQGGLLLIQYQTTSGLLTKQMGPLPFVLGRDRVTDQDAPMIFLDAKHPIFNEPNSWRRDLRLLGPIPGMSSRPLTRLLRRRSSRW